AAGALSAVGDLGGGDEGETLRMPGLTVAPLPGEGEIAKFDLTFGFSERATGLAGTVRYSRSLFDAPTAARIAAHPATLLTAAAAQPDLPAGELPLLSEAEAHQALHEWNDDLASYPGVGLTPERIAAREWRHPDAVALALEEERMSYGELRARS